MSLRAAFNLIKINLGCVRQKETIPFSSAKDVSGNIASDTNAHVSESQIKVFWEILNHKVKARMSLGLICHTKLPLCEEASR